jgi:hypothetical protein
MLVALFTDQRRVDDCPRWMEDGSAWKNSILADGLAGGAFGSILAGGGGGGGGGAGVFFLQPAANIISAQANTAELISLLFIS